MQAPRPRESPRDTKGARKRVVGVAGQVGGTPVSVAQ